MSKRKRILLTLTPLSLAFLPIVAISAQGCSGSNITVEEHKAKLARDKYYNFLDKYNSYLSAQAKIYSTKKKELSAIDKKSKEHEYNAKQKEIDELLKSTKVVLNTKREQLNKLYDELKVAQEDQKIQTIRILHTNDEHGRIKQDDSKYNNYAGMVGFSKYIKDRKYDLLLSSGDLIQGLPFSDSDKGKTITKIAAQMGYAAIAVGNHEFDFGLEHTVKLDEEIKSSGTRFLSANVVYKDKQTIDPTLMDKAGTRPYTPYLIKELTNGLKVALIGITTPDSAYTSHPKNSVNVNFVDPVTATKEILQEIRQRHPDVNFTIALTHLGVGRNEKAWESTYLAQQVPELDLILDGHSHTKYELRELAKSYISQTECYTKYFGDITLDFDKSSGKIVFAREELRDINQIILEQYGVELDSKISRLISELETTYKDTYSKGAFTLDTQLFNTRETEFNGQKFWEGRVKQSTLGLFTAEAMAWDFYTAKKDQIADLSLENVVGLQNGGGIRADLTLNDPDKPEEIKKESVLAVAPFGNMIDAVSLKGSSLKETIKHGLSKAGSGAFAQWSSNVSFTVNKVTTSDGKVKYELDESTLKLGGKAIDDDKTYYVVTNDFMVAGGDGYKMLDYHGSNDVKQVYESQSLFDTFIKFGKYLNEHKGKADKLGKEPFTKEMTDYGKEESLKFITYK
ncbi:bifunctional metallophosphatase/5'-nucleotidase [Mycoplasmopsis caviae]|uniref:Trifunctional nucleotide phosphoesterase protein YfkN n=1 Tax=Mycoplasmopsis caviae TaxID=55603 RepID=A0A3P8KWC6_9BACT|nr:bifunctional UDP-sugar hydrolase/5'-nucleotidase [Mycoplasmopsis caviae]VDR41677.1 Trifunctional nucleotide phosphoesterase protein YfkN precursor [Mycoplasmopsis caviae]